MEKKWHKSTLFNKQLFLVAEGAPFLTEAPCNRKESFLHRGAYLYFTGCLFVWQLYCHNFRWLNLCSRVYKRSEHLSLLVQVEGDRVAEQFIFLYNYAPLTFHMRAPLCFHTSSTNWLHLIRLYSLQDQHMQQKEYFNTADLSRSWTQLCYLLAHIFSSIIHVETKTNQKHKAGKQQTNDGSLFKPNEIWTYSTNLYNIRTPNFLFC